MARRPVGFAGKRGREERGTEKERGGGKGKKKEREAGMEVGKSSERRAEYQERRRGKNTERMREIRIYILV